MPPFDQSVKRYNPYFTPHVDTFDVFSTSYMSQLYKGPLQSLDRGASKVFDEDEPLTDEDEIKSIYAENYGVSSEDLDKLDFDIPLDKKRTRGQVESHARASSREYRYQRVLSNADPGFGTTLASFAGTIFGDASDPISFGSMFVPVVSQARLFQMTSKYGAVLGRAYMAAVEGAVGAAMVEPFQYFNEKYIGINDYDLQDSLTNIAFSSAFSIGLRVPGGALYDRFSAGPTLADRASAYKNSLLGLTPEGMPDPSRLLDFQQRLDIESEVKDKDFSIEGEPISESSDAASKVDDLNGVENVLASPEYDRNKSIGMFLEGVDSVFEGRKPDTQLYGTLYAAEQKLLSGEITQVEFSKIVRDAYEKHKDYRLDPRNEYVFKGADGTQAILPEEVYAKNKGADSEVIVDDQNGTVTLTEQEMDALDPDMRENVSALEQLHKDLSAKADEPEVKEPEAGEPKAGEPKAGEPKAGEPEVKEPEAGEPEANKPNVNRVIEEVNKCSKLNEGTSDAEVEVTPEVMEAEVEVTPEVIEVEATPEVIEAEVEATPVAESTSEPKATVQSSFSREASEAINGSGADYIVSDIPYGHEFDFEGNIIPQHLPSMKITTNKGNRGETKQSVVPKSLHSTLDLSAEQMNEQVAVEANNVSDRISELHREHNANKAFIQEPVSEQRRGTGRKSDFGMSAEQAGQKVASKSIHDETGLHSEDIRELETFLLTSSEAPKASDIPASRAKAKDGLSNLRKSAKNLKKKIKDVQNELSKIKSGKKEPRKGLDDTLSNYKKRLEENKLKQNALESTLEHLKSKDAPNVSKVATSSKTKHRRDPVEIKKEIKDTEDSMQPLTGPDRKKVLEKIERLEADAAKASNPKEEAELRREITSSKTKITPETEEFLQLQGDKLSDLKSELVAAELGLDTKLVNNPAIKPFFDYISETNKYRDEYLSLGGRDNVNKYQAMEAMAYEKFEQAFDASIFGNQQTAVSNLLTEELSFRKYLADSYLTIYDRAESNIHSTLKNMSQNFESFIAMSEQAGIKGRWRYKSLNEVVNSPLFKEKITLDPYAYNSAPITDADVRFSGPLPRDVSTSTSE